MFNIFSWIYRPFVFLLYASPIYVLFSVFQKAGNITSDLKKILQVICKDNIYEYKHLTYMLWFFYLIISHLISFVGFFFICGFFCRLKNFAFYILLLLLLLSRFSRVWLWPHRRQPTRLPRPCDSPGKNTGVGCHFLPQCMKVKSESEVAQSCPTLSDPMDCSLPGSSVLGISQARVLEWGAIAFSIAFI